MLKKSSSGALVSLKCSTYRNVRLASSLAASLLNSLFEHPANVGSSCQKRVGHRSLCPVKMISPQPTGARNLVVAATSFILLLASGCTKQDPYSPPDLFYYFASYKVGKNPTTITTTDVNQDGFTDLVTTNMGSNTLSILLGNGDGTFGDQIELNVCKEPRSLALGMFNPDPFPDVVLACSGADEVAVLFGRADGKLQEGTRYPVHRSPIAIAIDDLNGDQAPDFVVALRNDKIKVFLGTGTGEFTHWAQYEYGDTPTSLALADLDGDGKIDLAVTNGGADVECSLYLDGEWGRHVSPSH